MTRPVLRRCARVSPGRCNGRREAVSCRGPYENCQGTDLAPEGFCESAGNHFRPGELPLLDMYLTGVTLRIARDNVRNHIPDALDLARSGQVAPERVVSHVIDWEQLPDALPEKHLKPVFVRDIPASSTAR
jgi:hypothetical protein